MKKTLSYLFSLSLVLSLVTPASALLLKTYDFETPITSSFGPIDEGWQTALNPGGIWRPTVGESATAPYFYDLPSGAQVAYTKNGSLWINTGIVLEAGVYRVSAFVGNSANDPLVFEDDFFFRAAYQESASSYPDVVKYTYTDLGVGEGHWLEVGFTFDVDPTDIWFGKSLALGFNASGNESGIIALDHVTVESVSVPDSGIFMLLGPSLVGLGIVGRRKVFQKRGQARPHSGPPKR